GAGGVGAADRVHGRERPVLPEGKEREQSGVEAEVAVEVERGFRIAGMRRGNPDGGPERTVRTLAVGHDDVQPVAGPPLEHDHERLLAARFAGLDRRRAREDARHDAERDEGEARGLEEDASLHFRWNSGEPRMRPAIRAGVASADSASSVLRVASDSPAGTRRAPSVPARSRPSPSPEARTA